MKSPNIFDLIDGLIFNESFSQLALIGFYDLPAIEGGHFFSLLSRMFTAFGTDLLNGNVINGIFLIAKLEAALQKGLRIISLFAFIIATIVVMYGGYQIRTGNADAGKMSILGGLVIGLAVIIVTSIFEIADLPVLKVTK